MCSPFIKPPTTCLSCQWPHWLANSKFKPLPPLPPPCMWPVTVKSPEVGDSFQMHRITHLPLYPLQCLRVFFPPLVEQLLRMQLSSPAQFLIVSECIPFMPAQDKLACIYEWKWRILLFGTQPAGVIRLLSQDVILMEYLYHEMLSNFCFNYDTWIICSEVHHVLEKFRKRPCFGSWVIRSVFFATARFMQLKRFLS